MIRAIREINFPKYATLTEATVSLADMGERTITTQVHIDGGIAPDFSFDWEVEFRGERYIHMARTPQASKDNTSMRSTIDMVFRHKAIVELRRYYFVDMASTESGTAIVNKYSGISLGLNLPDFITALNKVLDYYYKGRIKAVLNPAWQSSSEPSYMSIDYTIIWDVLTKIYEVYACRWVIERGESEDTYLIKFGYESPERTHIFEYGYNGGLLKVERQVQDTDIRNVLLGRGGDRNIPRLYFKDYNKYGDKPEIPSGGESGGGSSSVVEREYVVPAHDAHVFVDNGFTNGKMPAGNTEEIDLRINDDEQGMFYVEETSCSTDTEGAQVEYDTGKVGVTGYPIYTMRDGENTYRKAGDILPPGHYSVMAFSYYVTAEKVGWVTIRQEALTVHIKKVKTGGGSSAGGGYTSGLGDGSTRSVETRGIAAASETTTIDITGIEKTIAGPVDAYKKAGISVRGEQTFTVPDGKYGTIVNYVVEMISAERPEATSSEIWQMIVDGTFKYYDPVLFKEVDRAYITACATTLQVFNVETGEEANLSAIPAGEYYYVWTDEILNNYTMKLRNIKVKLDDFVVYIGAGVTPGFPNTGNGGFEPDPDAIPELKNISFTELRSSEFRDYVRGWKYAHYAGRAYENPSWAYIKGATDEVFDPVEYVKDDESIARYGEQWGALDNNEDIYPTIQGSGVDDVIAVEEIKSDEVIDEYNSTKVETLYGTNDTGYSWEEERKSEYDFTWDGPEFSVDEGRIGVLSNIAGYTLAHIPPRTQYNEETASKYWTVTDLSVSVVSLSSPEKTISSVNIPAGSYRVKFHLSFKNEDTKYDKYFISFRLNDPLTLTTADEDSEESNPNTFHIWIKNIWDTTKGADETDKEYAERVWLPILGNGEDNAAVSFASGWLSISDYEFSIVKPNAVVFDDSKTNSKGEKSHWRLNLAKSDAEYESTGKLIPNTGVNAQAGDRFYFTGIDVPHQYVLWAEQRLHDWKVDNLRTTSDIQPAWVVSIDKVRANKLEAGDVEKLIEQLSVGSQIRLRDKRFMPNAIPMYIQTVTYIWKQPTNDNPYIHPDVEVVLSDKVLASTNTIGNISNELEAIRNQIGGSLSNIEQVVRSVGDRTYLRKDGIPDIEAGQVTFQQDTEHQGRTWFRGDTIIGKQGFASGITGIGGKVDSYGNAELESLVLRRFLEVPELRYNRIEVQIGNHWRAPGGGIIESVMIDPPTDDETESLSGIIYLHLEDGEIGAIAEDDLCMGIYHNEYTQDENATENTDDSKGNFNFAGFCTCYFRITEIIDEGTNSVFRYALRQKSETWTKTHHPTAGMHFVCYGNPNNKNRQHSRYSTLTYERYLKDVTTWEFQANNIAAQFGDLSNLNIYGLKMEGYSAYLNNIYMTGTIEQVSVEPVRMEIDTRGDYFLAWGESMVCTCYVYKGWTDVSDKVQKWTVTRESGNAKDDEAWANKDKVKNFARSITLSYSADDNDLGSNPNVISVLFHFKAEWTEDDGTAQAANYTLEI